MKVVSYNMPNKGIKDLIKGFKEAGYKIKGDVTEFFSVHLDGESDDEFGEKVAETMKIRPNGWSLMAIDGLLTEV
jgi:hypothetical protein